MIESTLREIGGIGAYGIISLCLFFAVFCGALLWCLAREDSFCERMSSLPLEKDEDSR